MTISVFDGKKTIANWPAVGTITVAEADYYGTGRLPDTRYQGFVLSRCSWEFANEANKS
jgi:hypothetical protein